MKIDLLFIAHNRLHYTRKALASVLADPSEEFSLTIWDNASDDGTLDYLDSEVHDQRIARIIRSPVNVGQTAAMNEVWSSSNADLLGKLDNDCLVSPGWTRALAHAHQDIPNLGVVACWHFFPEDFSYEAARHKIQTFGSHQILRHPWTCGTGLLFKRQDFVRFGRFRDKATTDYWLRMARAGRINGFYYPLICQENMDDLRSVHNARRSMSFEQAYAHSHGWKTGTIKDGATCDQLQRRILNTLLTGPWDPAYYHPSMWKRLSRQVCSVLKGQGLAGLRRASVPGVHQQR